MEKEGTKYLETSEKNSVPKPHGTELQIQRLS